MQTMYSNNLINETSKYLLQHAHNPVNWYPWGNEALEKAKKENKLLLISIGYASCHWCHVMEKESFTDVTIAETLNNNFVCIKVDREERPDLDHSYMMAVQILTGQGGWPLNCFCLPDGTPFFGGTYFRPEQFHALINKISADYKSTPELFSKTGSQVVEIIREQLNQTHSTGNLKLSLKELAATVETWSKNFDSTYGGDNRAPKFPMPSNYVFLTNYFYHTKDQKIYDHLIKTLDNIAQGGIYDQLEGGFFRYSTDEEWKVPHFEKMLYDNAQLVSLYSKAYLVTKQPLYKKIVKETVEFLTCKMTSPEGGFYASFDADSEGEEGKYYTWPKDEIDRLLGNNAKLFNEHFGISNEGSIDGKNVLAVHKNIAAIAEEYNIPEKDLNKLLLSCKATLLAERNLRTKPDLDKKIILSWNAMMLEALSDAYLATGDCLLIEWAVANAEFIESDLMEKDGTLIRIYNNNEKIYGFLDDYAFTASSFISLYQTTFDSKWAYLAKKITDKATDMFFDTSRGLYLYSKQTNANPLATTFEISDNVIPSSNAKMAHVLVKLAKIFRNPVYFNKAEIMLQNVKNTVLENPSFHSHWADLYLKLLVPPMELTITGTKALIVAFNIGNVFLPDIFLTGTLSASKLPIVENRFNEASNQTFICREQVCYAVANSVEEARREIAKLREETGVFTPVEIYTNN